MVYQTFYIPCWLRVEFSFWSHIRAHSSIHKMRLCVVVAFNAYVPEPTFHSSRQIYCSWSMHSQCVQSTQTHNLGCIQTSTCGSVHVFYPYKDNRLDTCLCPFRKVHHSHEDFGCGQWTKVDGRTNLLPSIKMTCLSWRSSCATVMIIVIIIITFLSKKRES